MDNRKAVERLFTERHADLLRVARKLERQFPEDLLSATLLHLLQYPGPPANDLFRVACYRMKQLVYDSATVVVRRNGRVVRVRYEDPGEELRYLATDIRGRRTPRRKADAS